MRPLALLLALILIAACARSAVPAAGNGSVSGAPPAGERGAADVPQASPRIPDPTRQDTPAAASPAENTSPSHAVQRMRLELARGEQARGITLVSSDASGATLAADGRAMTVPMNGTVRIGNASVRLVGTGSEVRERRSWVEFYLASPDGSEHATLSEGASAANVTLALVSRTPQGDRALFSVDGEDRSLGEGDEARFGNVSVFVSHIYYVRPGQGETVGTATLEISG